MTDVNLFYEIELYFYFYIYQNLLNKNWLKPRIFSRFGYSYQSYLGRVRLADFFYGGGGKSAPIFSICDVDILVNYLWDHQILIDFFRVFFCQEFKTFILNFKTIIELIWTDVF